MLRFIIPAIIIFLIILFWEKINKEIYKRFFVKVNYVVVTITFLALGVIFALLYF